MEGLDSGVEAGHADGEELHRRVELGRQAVLSGVRDGQVTVLMQGHVQRVRADLHHPGVGDDHPGARTARGELIDAAELGVDGGGHGSPAGLRLSVSAERPADGVILPAASGPVQSQNTAHQQHGQRDAEVQLPAHSRLMHVQQILLRRHQTHSYVVS